MKHNNFEVWWAVHILILIVSITTAKKAEYHWIKLKFKKENFIASSCAQPLSSQQIRHLVSSACLFYVSFSTLIPAPHQTKAPQIEGFFGLQPLIKTSIQKTRPTRKSEKKSSEEMIATFVCFKMIFLCVAVKVV